MGWDDLAKRHAFEKEPLKIGLVVLPIDNPPVTIAVLLELHEDAIVIGTTHPDDIFRTTFDRFTGLAVDHGRLHKHLIPASELQRIEKFAAEGAYVDRSPSPKGTPPAVSEPFDPDQMM